MRIMQKALSLLLSASMVISLAGPLPVWAAGPQLPDNLEDLVTESCAVTVSSLQFHCFRYTSSTDTSAGDTPDILDACPMDAGRIAFSFCFASMRRL